MRPTILFLLLAPLALLAVAARANAGSEAVARKLIDSQGCKACHRIDGSGAVTGPDLDTVGSRLTRQQLRAKLVNPQKKHGGGHISDFSHLRKEDLDALTAYLGSRK